MNTIVLIADIVSSRKIKDRDRIQKILGDLFKKINRNSATILSPITITLGDEFQCVYSRADEIFSHIWKTLEAVYPERIRFSYGIGEITTKINKQQAIGMDGPAFYEAREGLIQLKKDDYLLNLSIKDNKSSQVNFIRNILYLLSNHIEGWKKNRIKIISLLEREKEIKSIAEELKISEQAVYKNISNGSL